MLLTRTTPEDIAEVPPALGPDPFEADMASDTEASSAEEEEAPPADEHLNDGEPQESLFGADLPSIHDLLSMLVTADTTREVKCQVVLNDDGHSAYAFVVIPKRQYSEDLREHMETALRQRLADRLHF